MKLADIHIRDPFILPFSGTYYLYRSSTASGEPGFSCYTGTDLENWEGPFTVFTPPADYWGTKDFWAPEVHHYNGKFYLLASFKSETACRGTAILISDSPMGPFVPHSGGAVTPRDWECLDGTLYAEDGVPYMVFCHEWLQVRDGTVCAVELTPDLKAPVGEPFLLWNAGSAPWVGSVRAEGHFVTDGPFLLREDGRLTCLWSSYDKTRRYVQAIAKSADGTLRGPWDASDPPIPIGNDCGHGMIFTAFGGTRKFICHYPSSSPEVHPVLYTIRDSAFIQD